MLSTDLRYFLSGNTAVDLAEPNPNNSGKKWLENKAWGDILGLEDCNEVFKGVVEDVKSDLNGWQKIFETSPLKCYRFSLSKA